MPRFAYTAIAPDGQVQDGTMDARDAAAVISILQRQGAVPVRAELAGTSKLSKFSLLAARAGGQARLSRQDVMNFTRELAVMLGAGLDLDGALRFLIDTASGQRSSAVLGRLRETVRDGGSLAKAVAQQPRSFSPLYCGMVRAGEAGGRLAPALDQLATLLERQGVLATNIRSALVYPAVLVVAAVGSVVLLLVQVLPQFTPLFIQNNVALPGPTQFLVDAGAALAAYGVPVALGLLVAGLLVRPVLRRPGLRLAIDQLVLRTPVLGRLVKEVLAARFSRTFGTLLTNGVSLTNALTVAQGALGNRAAAVAVDAAAEAARRGEDLSGTLRSANVFPVRLPTLLRLGHETGQLGPMALRAAAVHEEASRAGLQRMVALLVPAITIVMGALIAGIVASLLLAMLSLNDLAN